MPPMPDMTIPDPLIDPAEAVQDEPAERPSRRPMLLRAALSAAALSLVVSGGAYAAVVATGDGPSSSTAALSGQDLGAEGGRSGQPVAAATQGAATVTTVTEETTQAHGRVEKPSASVPEGETRVETEGVDGVVRTTYQVTLVDGKETSRVEISSVVVTQAVDEVVLVGTATQADKTPAPKDTGSAESSQAPQAAPTAEADSSGSDSGSGDAGSGGSSSGGSAPEGVWAQLAQCESGGDPTANTGNGYYGLYQFSLQTWQSVGGSGLPSEASAEEQTMRAQALQQSAGWGQWPHCAAKLGLL
ncbi:resuscitation-promoting factor [Actinomyces slackii]